MVEDRNIFSEKIAEGRLQSAINLRNNYYFCVFPAWDWDKPCSKRWQKQSTRSLLDIRKLWNRYPGAMPGIDLEKSGIVIFECAMIVDGERNFIELCSRLNLQIKELTSLIVQAPCGDLHYYFRLPGQPLPSGRIACGVNVRCAGDFVPGPDAIRADLMQWKVVKKSGYYYEIKQIPLQLHSHVYEAFRYNILK
jgi:Bifunctional DNA primase/polymerase, N-terminal